MVWTKDDFARYRREQRKLYPGKQAKYLRDRRHLGRAILDGLKNKPCADCGKAYPPYVMDFDHVRGAKLYVPSKTHQLAIAALLSETDKCDVVCSNCHRERTHRRGTSKSGAMKGAKARWNL